MKPININQKLTFVVETWSPRIIAQMNDVHFKIAKIVGEFIWHQHEETDEVFMVIMGEMLIHLREKTITLRTGEMVVVPRGVEHKPEALEECHILMVERAGTLNTGDQGGERTVKSPEWI